MSRSDIECPGDTIPYNCSIQSNSETVHLIWRITLPGQAPINSTYDATSSLDTEDSLDASITTILTRFRNEEYIESVLTILVLKNVSLNSTIIECSSGDLDADTQIVFVNTSGMQMHCTCKSLAYDILLVTFPL